jgi:hypothetical protein
MEFTENDVAYWYRSYFATESLSPWQRLMTGLVRLRGVRRAIRQALKNRAGQERTMAAVKAEASQSQRRAA